jgi:hypothetical protein
VGLTVNTVQSDHTAAVAARIAEVGIVRTTARAVEGSECTPAAARAAGLNYNPDYTTYSVREAKPPRIAA